METKQQSYFSVEPKTLPGYFTGIYTAEQDNYRVPRSDYLNNIAFSDVLEKTYYENNPGEIDLYVNAKVRNSSSGLPFVGALMAEVGTYGLVLASSLKLCQYYKKSSPPPKYF